MTGLVSLTLRYALLERDAYEQLMASYRRRTLLARELNRRVQAESQLLTIALNELAIARGVKDRQNWTRRWINERRQIPDFSYSDRRWLEKRGE